MSDIPPNVISFFLGELSKHDPELADLYYAQLAACFRTDAGISVLDLLEKCVILTPPPPDCSDRALRQRHGQHLLVAEIRRIVKHGDMRHGRRTGRKQR